MDRLKALENTYDTVASQYDGKYQEPIHVMEDDIISEIVSPLVSGGDIHKTPNRVLDVGCGTGHILNLTDIEPDRYLGIDLSQGMLEIANTNHPDHKFMKHNILDGVDTLGRFDVILGIYGIVNYIGIDGLVSMLNRYGESGCKFLMVIYTEHGHKDYEYTSEFRNTYKPSDLRNAFRGEVFVRGFSHVDTGNDMARQLDNLLRYEIEDDEADEYKYMILTNYDFGD